MTNLETCRCCGQRLQPEIATKDFANPDSLKPKMAITVKLEAPTLLACIHLWLQSRNK